ncbi:MAG: hypothetical protein US69_C0005G0039 [candidate division TM6 bacterium GW2011_GWF2_38_10]|nr:MAG: hypothetical protein US69_C0005G0039 [candidate division TM6 bacterium GW2011_GWF2_38_10]
MHAMIPNQFKIVSNNFHQGVRYNLCGSIMYELIKTVHNFFLLNILTHSDYGLIASVISIIYFASKVADIGAASSLSLMFMHLTQSRLAFKKLFKKYYLYPHIPLMLIIALCIAWTNHYHIQASHFWVWALVPIIMLGESIRYFLRIFLHAAFKSRHVVFIEVLLYVGFVAMVWIPYLLYQRPIDLAGFLIAHVIDTWVCTTIFIGYTYFFYTKLPAQTNPPPHPSTTRIWYTKIINYSVRISRDFFASNFLTPLFAYKCGLEAAGAFYFASVIVNALHSTIKMSIHYPANGLLWNLHTSSHTTKKEAFSLLFHKLTTLIIPIIIFIAINHSWLLRLGNYGHMTSTTMLIIAALISIAILDSLLLLYEQFYIAEQATHSFLLLKVLECILLYSFVIKSTQTTLLSLLIYAVMIKLLSFGITILNAFSRWRIKPTILIQRRWLIGASIISGIFYYIMYLFFR